MKIHFRQHIPSFYDGFEPEEFDAETLEELLKKEARYLKSNKHNLVWACDTYDNTLMVSATDANWWWVVGFVEGIELIEHLPYFKSCCKILTNQVEEQDAERDVINTLEKIVVNMTKEEFINKILELGSLCYTVGNNKMVNAYPKDGKLMLYTYEFKDESEVDEIKKTINDKVLEYRLKQYKEENK